MKALERLVEILPVPLLAGAALAVLLGWFIKEYRIYSQYGQVFRDPLFHSSILILFLSLIAYYSIIYLYKGNIPPSQSGNRIIISEFSNDAQNTVRNATSNKLAISLLNGQGTSDVSIFKLDFEVDASNQAQKIISEKNAIALMHGTVHGKNSVQYNVFWKTGDAAINRLEKKFPEIDPFIASIQSIIEKSRDKNVVNESAIQVLEEDYASLQSELLRLNAKLDTIINPQSDPIKKFSALRKKAVLIGNFEYLELSNLRGNEQIGALASSLSSAGYEVEVYENLNNVRFKEVLEEAKQKNADKDHLVFFYSGMGHWEGETGDSYIFPVDYKSGSPERGLLLKELMSEILEIGVENTTIILDTMVGPNFFNEVPRKAGLFVLTGSSPGQFAYDTTETGGGVFTHFLNKTLSRIETDTKEPRVVGIAEIALSIRNEVSGFKEIPEPQVPAYLSMRSEGIGFMTSGSKLPVR